MIIDKNMKGKILRFPRKTLRRLTDFWNFKTTPPALVYARMASMIHQDFARIS